MDVGTRIREHRETAGLRQDQLAEICGVSRQTISNWERNKTLPDIASLKVMAHELGTTIDALVGDDVPEIKRRTEAEARRFLVLFALNYVFMLFSFVMNFGADFGDAFTSPPWMYIRTFVGGAWLIVLIPYVRVSIDKKLWYYEDIGRYLEKNLVLGESRATRAARGILKHIQIWNGVLATLAILAGLAAGGALTPPLAVLVIIGSAALSVIAMRRDKERQRWGGSVNPPLPPQR